MSGGGKGGGSAVVGWRYFLGVQIACSHGPVDSIRRLIFGEREAFKGLLTYPANTTVNINQPELFGGDSREGGVVGDIDILWGDPNQGRNAYLAAHQGANCPAYRGLFTLVFKQFMWSSGNPYFKAPWVEFTRIKAGWRDETPWNPTKAEIVVGPGEPPDMNPAHIIYQCLTDIEWGMGYNTSDIDDTSFLAAAQTLYDEGFGLSLMWDQQSEIEAFVKKVIDHIDGSLNLDLSTGKFVLKLHRNDYTVGSLTNLNESNILELKSFQRATYGEFANEVVVTYVDRDGNEKPVAVQDLAGVQAQGSVVSTSRDYPGVRYAPLAAKLAMRDLRVTGTPLAKASLTTNRVLFNKEMGDVVSLTWAKRGVAALPMRIIKIDKGSLANGRIEVELVEDVFTLPGQAYTSSLPTMWADPVIAPSPADDGMPIESPYWDVARRLTRAELDYLSPDYGFGSIVATEGSLTVASGFKLAASPDNVTYDDVNDVQFCPTGLLAASITPTQTTFTLSAAYSLDKAILAADGGYAYVGMECVSVVSVNPSTGQVVVGRGVLDTTPKPHAAGTRVYFTSSSQAYDPTERVAGETVYYKARTKTGLGTLPVEDATVETLVFANRASRPYPPGNFKINGLSYPSLVSGPEITASWSHRDRLAQTVDLVDHTVGNIGPEPGTSYRMRVYSGATLLRTYDITGDTTTWGYPTNDSTADGSLNTVRLVLTSVRDGLESWDSCAQTVSRSTVAGGTYIDTPPATPTITATPVNFGIQLNWVFGDLRTNLAHTEIWASDTPTFSDGQTLHYETYPGTSYLHELTDVGAYRWYWARVGDVDGNLSPWSAVSWARALFQTGGIPDVTSLPVSPVDGAEVVRLTTDNMIYVWNPTTSTWRTAVNAADIQGLIVGTQIAANTITADRLTATNLSGIFANLGHITSGDITIDNSGFIRGGSTGYLTGAGFWMGYHSGAYKFHIGDPTGQYIAWTGSALSISGTLNAVTGTFGAMTVAAGGNIKMGQTGFNMGDGFFLGDDGGVAKFSIGSPSGSYLYWDGVNLAMKGTFIDQNLYTAGGTIYSAASQLQNYISQFGGNVTLRSWTTNVAGSVTVSINVAYASGFSANGLSVSIRKNGTVQGAAYTLTQVDPTFYTLSRTFSVANGDVISVVAVPGSSNTYANHKNFTVSKSGTYVVALDNSASAGLSSATYTMRRKIQMARGGAVTVRFNLWSSTGSAYGRIYKNGVAVGTERTVSTTTPTTFDENITFIAGDTLELWTKTGTATTVYTGIFELYADQVPYSSQVFPIA